MSRTGKFFLVMRTDLKRDPAVMQMAREIKTREEVVIGYLHAVWSWFIEQSDDGIVKGVTMDDLGRVLGLDKFPQHMEATGWLKEWRDDFGNPQLIVPNFDRWLSGKAARRTWEAQRKRDQRTENTIKQDISPIVPEVSGQCPDNVLDNCRLQEQEQEQEQEQKEKKTPISPFEEKKVDNGEPDGLQTERELIQLWNQTPGVKKIHGRGGSIFLSETRRTKLLAKLTINPGWFTDFKESLAKFPLHGAEGWQPDITFMLKDDNVERILEGTFDKGGKFDFAEPFKLPEYRSDGSKV